MPSVSKKQHNFMEAVAHNSKFAKRVGIPQSVGQDFHKADMKKKTRKFAMGGNMPMQGMPIPRPAPGMMSNMDAQGMQPPNIPGQVGGLQGMPPQGMPMGYKKGGHVMETKVADYFAKKGEKSLAAHEKREAQGKEEDTKAIAKKEERVLKGAPKGLREYEQKEHKGMGFGKGGMAKHKKVGPFSKLVRKAAKAPPKIDPALADQSMPPDQGMPPSMGGMPPDQGMPPSMGGGMPPSMGGGMPGMKKGGRIKKHFDEGGDLKAASDRRQALFGGRPAMGRTPASSPTGRPVIGPRPAQTSQNISRLSAAAGGKKGGSVPKGMERKGSTSAKKVKMARGGGCESKGKTKGRMC